IDKILTGLKEIFAPNLIALTGAGLLKEIIIILLILYILKRQSNLFYIILPMLSFIFYRSY
ncbi:hypothetical protein, partial [Jeotgalibaca porci]|uniref:hypothetical protein n=1 Tax=Jeotgalibaca porci TaxID=1868793 RepID=UPI0035A128A2